MNTVHFIMNTVHKFYKKLVYFIYPRSFDLFSQHSCQVCTTEHQSCQEPETLSVGHFFQKNLLDLCEMSLIGY